MNARRAVVLASSALTLVGLGGGSWAQAPPLPPPPAVQEAPAKKPTPAPVGVQVPGFVTNVYADAEIRAVLAEIGSLAGVTVIPDSSITAQTITIEFKNEPIESAVRRVAEFGGYYVKKKGDSYLLSSGAPDAPLFNEFAILKRYVAQNTMYESLERLLPTKYKGYVQGDKATNMLTVLAPPELADRIVETLKAIDCPMRQIVVEALVTEVTADESEDFGFSWNWKQFGIDSDQSINYAKAGFADVAKVKALITSGKATVRANPRMSAMEGRETSLSVGQDLYFALLAGNPNFPISQIQQIRTGVTLKFSALIGDDGWITLNLEPEIGDAVTLTAQGNPLVTIRRASTMVRVKPGETVVIGGLVQEFVKKTRSKIPILGDLPFIGWLFQKTSSSRKRTELILMITPRLSEKGAGGATSG